MIRASGRVQCYIAPMQSVALLQLVFAAAAATGVYSFVRSASDGETRRLCTPACALRPNYSGYSRRAPDFELKNLDGETRRLSDYRGKVVILNFWTKSCKPCLEEMPSIADFAEVLAAEPNIEVVTISNDESAEDARNTLRSIFGRDPRFETLIDPDTSVVADRFGTNLYPETWFIDPDGVVRARFDGARDWNKPLHLEFAQSLVGPARCPITFNQRKPEGPRAPLCLDIPRAPEG